MCSICRSFLSRLSQGAYYPPPPCACLALRGARYNVRPDQPEGERILAPTIGRLYASIEAATVDGTDPPLKERTAALKSTRDRAIEAFDYARKSGAVPVEIDPVAIDHLTRLTRAATRLGRRCRPEGLSGRHRRFGGQDPHHWLKGQHTIHIWTERPTPRVS
jgi:hypothetical protein